MLAERIAGLEGVDFEARDIFGEFADMFGAADERRKRAEVHGHDVADAEQPDGVSGFARAHRVVIADGEQREIGRVEFGD